MSTNTDWLEVILGSSSAELTWQKIFEKLQELALNSSSATQLHKDTIAPDRLLAESAWNLWQSYLTVAPRTSVALKEWWQAFPATNSAVLILDALSLRQLPALLAGAKARNITPVGVRVTGAEAPSDTDQFARALGAASRSSLQYNGAATTFKFQKPGLYTEVLSLPFIDSLGSIPVNNNLFIWHSWLDDLVHLHKDNPDQVYTASCSALQGDDFWAFVDRLRTGRRLVITADHGYAESLQFSSEAKDPIEIGALRDVLGASRYKKIQQPWSWHFMPPVVLSLNQHYVVIGQKKWTVQGGFPRTCHGGLSLLEIAVPFIELPAIGANH